MNSTRGQDEWGPRLYAYLEDYWRAAGTNANAWASQHPAIQGPTVSRWKIGGTVPSLPAMIAVADALGVPVLDVLLAVGVVSPDEVGRSEQRAEAPSIDAAIKSDPSLADWQRRNLRDFVDAMRRVDAGAQRVTKATSRGRHKTT